MASPLHLFRKYQYAFLVGFGIMLMFAFVVAPPLMDYLQTQPGASGSGNAVVVTWKSGELRESDLERMRVQHVLTTRFLSSLVRRVEVIEEATVDLKGEPITLIKGRSFSWIERTPTGYQIVIDGTPVQVPDSAVRQISPKANLINPANSEEELVHRMILAQKAKEIGVVIGEDAVVDYLDNLIDASSDNRPNYTALLRAATDGRLDINQFNQQMAMELAAQRMTMMAQAGLYTVSPAKLFECYNRLHRRVTAEMLAVDVAEFVKDVPDPATDAVLALYEEGKNRFSNPFAAEPGFKQRQRIGFGYFKGDFEQFVAREVEAILPTITDEQVEKYYEDNKASQYTVTELPPDAPATTPPAAEATPPAAPATPETAPPAPESTPDTRDGATPPASTAPAPESPTSAPPTEPTPPAEPGPTTEPEQPAPATPDPAAPPAEEGKQLSSDGVGGPSAAPHTDLVWVSFEAQEPAPEDPAPTLEPATPSIEPGTPPADPATPPVEPALTPQEMPAAPDAPAPQEPPADPEPPAAAQTTPADAPAQPATPPADPAASGQATAETPAGDQPAPKPVQYKPLDDALRTQIRQTLARDAARIPAQEKLDRSANVVRQAVEEYGKQLVRTKGLANAAKPTPPDFAVLAKDNNLTLEKTPSWDVLDVFQIQQAEPTDKDPACYDIARANEAMFSQQSGMIRRSLIDVGFAGDVALFMPRRLIDGFLAGDQFQIPPEKVFIYWREEVVPETTPPLEEIRDEVVRVWKMKQALPSARAQAEQLAKQAGEAVKPLSEVFADNATKVIKSNPFTWMTRGAVPGSTSGGATLSAVSGKAGEESVTISGVGEDFMRAVFDLKPGQVGVAVNQPETFVYVVRVETEEPSEEVRRDAFFKSGMTMEVLELVRDDQQAIYSDWISSLIKDNQIRWDREIHRNWNNE